MKVNIDEEYLTRALIDMVRIDSRNPSLTPRSPGEAEIGAYIAREMEALGMEVRTHELAAQRVNVVGVLKGSGGRRSLMWNAHMDTVGVEGMQEPFSAQIREGRLYGRGSQDMKGSLAAMLAAARALSQVQNPLSGDLIIAAVADEEYASEGTMALVKDTKADGAIVTEPTDLKLCRAHRGFILYDVETFGRAAHGSRYAEGIDAIVHMGRFLAELDRLGMELLSRTPHPLAGPPSLHASTIQGGTEVSVYPAHCLLKVERRTSPGETLEEATNEMQAIVERLGAVDETFKARIKPYMERKPYEIGADEEVVKAVTASFEGRFGEPPQHAGATFWTDAALLADAGIPTVILGPCGGGLHSDEEWVDVRSVINLAAVLGDAAIRFCH